MERRRIDVADFLRPDLSLCTIATIRCPAILYSMNAERPDDPNTSHLKPMNWFEPVPAGSASRALSALLRLGLGVCFGGVALLLGHQIVAVIIWAIAGAFGLLTLASETGAAKMSVLFERFGAWIGRIASVVLLTPLFLCVFPIIRLYGRITGSDPLRLRRPVFPTFWEPCDDDARKRKHIGSLFATEVFATKGNILLAWGAAAVIFVMAAEGVLRLMGFGHPILYEQDSVIGYYPAPNQITRRYGGLVATNRYGMRAPDYPDEKAPDVFRIFMIGDSTLWGGSNVDQKNLYARRIEDALNQERSTGRVEVWNLGVNGWGPLHKLAYVEKFGVFDADLAIICFPTRCIYRPQYDLARMGHMWVKAPPKLALEEVGYHAIWFYRRARLGPEILMQTEERAAIGIDAYCALARCLREDGCEVMAEILPSRFIKAPGDPGAREMRDIRMLTERLDAMGVPTECPEDLFQDNLDAYYQDPCHMRAAGHAVYAVYLKDRIETVSHRYKEWLQSVAGTAAHWPGADANVGGTS